MVGLYGEIALIIHAMRSALESTLALNNRISKIKMWVFFSKLVLTFYAFKF